MRTLITGATGLIGRGLVARVDDPVVLTRDPERAKSHLTRAVVHPWHAESGLPPSEALRDVEAVFHLAGDPVADGRWTEEKKYRIRSSRVDGTRHLVAGLAVQERRPQVLVAASAVGYYGDRGDERLDEDSPRGQGFLAEVCEDWEREAAAAEDLGIRVVSLRIGVVLAQGGGALGRMLPLFKMGVGGPIGAGRQWMSLVHIDDLIGILLYVSRNASLRGPVNAVMPTPVTNAEFTEVLAAAVHRPAIVPVPKLALRGLLGEMSQVLTASQRVYPNALERAGYVYEHRDIGSALTAIVSHPGASPMGR